MSSELRWFRGGVALSALAGLALRLIYVFGPGRHVSEFGDFHHYHLSANLIAHGHWFVDPEWLRISGKYVPSANHPPLWQLLLGLVSWLGGTGVLVQRAAGCFVGAVAIVLIGLVGRRVGGPRVGLAPGALPPVEPIPIRAHGAPVSEALFRGVVLCGLL